MTYRISLPVLLLVVVGNDFFRLRVPVLSVAWKWNEIPQISATLPQCRGSCNQ